MEFLAAIGEVHDGWIVLFIVTGAVARFGCYVWRKNCNRFDPWQPGELMFLRRLAILVTGKPANQIVWSRMDMVMFGLLLAGIILFLHHG